MASVNLDWFDLTLTSFELAYVFGIVLLAGVVRGLAGFGFSALCFFALAPVLSAQIIVPLMFVLEMLASLHLLPKVWRNIPWLWVTILFMGVIIGTPLGVFALQYWQPEMVRGLAGGGVLIACLALWRDWQFKGTQSLMWIVPVGFIAGFLNGLASIGGLVVAVYMLSSNMSMTAMRAGLILFFFFTDAYGLSWLQGQGLVSSSLPSLLVIMVPAMLVGNQMGASLFNHMDLMLIRKLTLGLLSLLATIALFSALFSALT